MRHNTKRAASMQLFFDGMTLCYSSPFSSFSSFSSLGMRHTGFRVSGLAGSAALSALRHLIFRVPTLSPLCCDENGKTILASANEGSRLNQWRP